MNRMLSFKALFIKYKAVIAYLFFGGCSTVLNIAVYALCYTVCALPNVMATIVAWLAAVLFAFITNKLWVFESKSFAGLTFLRELLTFFAARILTGVLDVAIMYVTVDKLHYNAILWKIIANIIVVILNYIASKYLIFLHKSEPI